MSNQGALAQFDDDAAIAAVASGKLMHQIAAEYGVVKSAIRKRLLKHPDYQAAIQSQAECLVDQTTAELMEVDADAVLIARARARVDAAHKWAAARDGPNWAGKGIQVNIGAVLNLDPASVSSIGALLERAAPQQSGIIEGETGEKDVTP